MSAARSDLDARGLFKTPVAVIGDALRRSLAETLRAKCPLPRALTSKLFGQSDRVTTDEFSLFYENWTSVRLFPNFAVLFLCLANLSDLPALTPRICECLGSLTTQTPGYHRSLANVIIPVVYSMPACSAYALELSTRMARVAQRSWVKAVSSLLTDFSATVLTELRQVLEPLSLTSDEKLLLTHSLTSIKIRDPSHKQAMLALEAVLSRPPASPSSSFSSLSHLAPNPDVLNSSLDEIDDNAVIEPFKLIRVLASQFRKQPFPNRPYRKLFLFCLKIWTSKCPRKVTDDGNIMCVLNVIHQLPNEVDRIFDVYMEISANPLVNEPARAGTYKMKVEQVYQRFRSANHGKLSDGRMLPYSLQNEEEVNVSTGIEMGLELLLRWKTAYDGVLLLWDVIREDPRIEIQSRFVKLTITQRCFLTQGFKRLAFNDNDRGTEDRLEIIENLSRLLVIGHESPVEDVRGLEDRLTKALEASKSPERSVLRTPRRDERPTQRVYTV
jgi:hypothetical protein